MKMNEFYTKIISGVKTFGKPKGFFIRIFGKRYIGIDKAFGGDHGFKITGYWLKGKFYVTEIEKLEAKHD